jgi:hypothetical protein
MRGVWWLCLISAAISAASFGAEFAVNTRSSDNQTYPAVAADANGNFVVVWTSYRQDGSSGGIFGQRFSADGQPFGDEFAINTTTAGNQTEPAVAMDAAGNFVAAWHGPGVIEEDIFARRFDVNGAPLGDEFLVNSVTESRQLVPSVAMNSDGNFVIVYESKDIGQIGKRAICGQLYDSSGSAVGGEFVANDQAAVCRYPAVAMAPNGEYIVVWTKDSGNKSIWLRRFRADATAPYLSSKVSDYYFTSLTRPAVAIDASGAHVIAWDGHPNTYLEDDIWVKRYHWSNAPLHEDFVVNTYTSGAQSNPSVMMTDDGEFLICWQSDTGIDVRGTDIFGQRFVSQGEHVGEPILLGDQLQINSYVTDDQRYPAVVGDNGGSFIAVWESNGQDGSGYKVFGQIGLRIRCADFRNDGFVNFGDYCVLAGLWLQGQGPLEADLVEDNRVDEKDLDELCRQWLRPCYDCSQVDLNGDGVIGFEDYAEWAAEQPGHGPGLSADITGDGLVDIADLRAIGTYWLMRCQ